MKAVIIEEFGAEDVLQYRETEMLKPSADQLLVRVKAAGVNPVDTYIRTGTHAQRPALPYTPGKDAAGIVESVGKNVENFKPGDRVLTTGSLTGTYAEFCLCSPDQLIKLPENVSFEKGAGVFVPYATSYRALFHRAKAQSGETVLIHGASGGVGVAATQWAKNAGLRVVGTGSSDDGKKLVKETGADFVFDHSSENYLSAIKETVGEVDIILEMLANENLVRDFEVLAQFGRIVVIGNRGSLDFNPRLAMGKDASILGMSLFNAPPEAMCEIYGAIYDGLEKGYLDPAVGRTFPLAQASEAHRAVIEDKAFGKIVLIP
ncbi:MAG: NADPH:quinone reductase [Pyrinomonadaceae bacterium]|nr:NADPH:quinone reductase [Pyrinomonadaceae bacterium]